MADFLSVIFKALPWVDRKLRDYYLGDGRLLHDKNLFQKVDSLINEDYYFNFLDYLKTNCSYSYSDRLQNLISLTYNSSRPEFSFINPKIEALKVDFISSFESLYSFMANNFFPHTSMHNKYRMRPEYNIDIEGTSLEDQEKFDDYKEELLNLVDQNWNAYISFREEVKRVLFI